MRRNIIDPAMTLQVCARSPRESSASTGAFCWPMHDDETVMVPCQDVILKPSGLPRRCCANN